MAAAVQGNLLVMQILGPYPRPTGSETLVGPRSLCLTNSPGDPYSHRSLSAIAEEGKLQGMENKIWSIIGSS